MLGYKSKLNKKKCLKNIIFPKIVACFSLLSSFLCALYSIYSSTSCCCLRIALLWADCCWLLVIIETDGYSLMGDLRAGGKYSTSKTLNLQDSLHEKNRWRKRKIHKIWQKNCNDLCNSAAVEWFSNMQLASCQPFCSSIFSGNTALAGISWQRGVDIYSRDDECVWGMGVGS